MKKSLFRLHARLAAICGLGLFMGTLQAETVLRFSDHEPVEAMRTQFLREVLFPAIERESKGRLKIEPHWNGELAGSYAAFDAVNKGEVDMATVVPEYAAKALPLHQVFKSFPLGPQGPEQVAFFRQAYTHIPELSKELRRNNLVEIFLATGYGVGFFSTEPLKSLASLQGQKWRTASFWHQGFLKNYGAIPVTIPWGQEVYQALKAKTLDGIMVNVDSGYDLKVYEQAPYVLASPKLWLGHLYIVAMNKNAWDKLTTAEQQAIQRAAKTSYPALGKMMESSFDAKLKQMQHAGAHYRILTPKELDAFEKGTHFQQEQARWIKQQQQQGVQNVEQVVQKVRNLLR